MLTLQAFKDNGPCTSVGSYPVHGYFRDGGEVCHACVMDATNPIHEGCPENGRCSEADPQWCFFGADVYWEGPELECSHCGAKLESAYGDPAEGKTMPHQHRKHQERNERCYSHAVAEPENRAAHGNITVEHVCRCGAVRLVNINGRHVERGPWIEE